MDLMDFMDFKGQKVGDAVATNLWRAVGRSSTPPPRPPSNLRMHPRGLEDRAIIRGSGACWAC